MQVRLSESDCISKTTEEMIDRLLIGSGARVTVATVDWMQRLKIGAKGKRKKICSCCKNEEARTFCINCSAEICLKCQWRHTKACLNLDDLFRPINLKGIINHAIYR